MDNSAARLLRVLERCKEIDTGVDCATAWREVLAAPDNNVLLGAFGEFFTLVNDTASEVLHRHPDLVDAVDHWRSRIFNGFNATQMNGRWEHFLAHIDNVTLFSLRSQAKVLHSEERRTELAPDQLSQIYQHLSQALELIGNGDMPVEIREMLIGRIENLQALINRYRFVGQKALLDSAKLLAADVASIPVSQIEGLKKAGIYDQIRESLAILANATTISATGPMIAGAAQNLLSLIR
ncbi:hypothetical protein ACFQZQ_12350 [Lysobacter koreensis]|uniref:Chemotaxis protein n=1 Tax=Lysobacter koreensis TaxID=266122 RepID=A0ABW2YNS2_9GAMM